MTPTGPVEPCGGSCGSLVCARDGACYPPEDIHAVHASWTIDGGQANSTSCTSDLYIDFRDDSGALSLAFAPVPCTAGKFTVDKLPRDYTLVFLNVGEDFDMRVSAPIDADGNALLDL